MAGAEPTAPATPPPIQTVPDKTGDYQVAKIRIVVGDGDPSANTVEIDGKQHLRVVALGFHAEPKDVVTLVVDELPPVGDPATHISTEYAIASFTLEAETLT